MKATGIVRKVDGLGRVVVPSELRNMLGMEEGTPLEIFTNGDQIVLKKYAPGCTLCGCVDRPKTQLYPDKLICTGCVDLIVRDQVSLKEKSTQP